MRIRPIALCLGLAVTPSLALTAHAQYDATVLPDVGGEAYSLPNAINASGQSVGFSDAASSYDAVLWSPSGKATVLQNARGGDNSRAFAINDAGQSVGFSATASGGSDAVRWSPSGRATVLQDAGGQGDSTAFAINVSGQSVGYSYTASSYDAVLWSPSGKATDLGAVLGSAWSDTYAVGLNNAGDIIGYGDYHGGWYGSEPPTWMMMLVGSRCGRAGEDAAPGVFRARPTLRAVDLLDDKLPNL